MSRNVPGTIRAYCRALWEGRSQQAGRAPVNAGTTGRWSQMAALVAVRLVAGFLTRG